MYFTTKELAVLFNRAERTIQKWVQEAKPKRQNNKYYAPDIFKWYEAKFVGGSDNEKKIKTALQAVELERKKLELDIMKGKYVEKEKVEIEWSQRVTELRQGLIALEFKIAKKLTGRKLTLSQVRKVLREEVYGILYSYAKEGEYTPQAFNIPVDVFEKEYFKFLEELTRKVNKNDKNKVVRKRKKKP